ncbi:MAG: amidase domain-containing protein [Candidatus Caccovivens sp.]
MIKEYDRQKAVDYAREWALSHNPAFYHYAGIGGDCTNFISQCLLFGDGVMDYSQLGWFYRSVNDHSASWTSVKFLNDFLLRKSGTGPFASVQPMNNLQIGDIIQLRQNPTHFNHTVIISKIENGNIYVCAHSNDALDKPLSRYYFKELKGLHIEGIRL